MAENAFHPNTADVFLDNFLRIGYTIINSRMGGIPNVKLKMQSAKVWNISSSILIFTL
jgi:hypothetical protein